MGRPHDRLGFDATLDSRGRTCIAWADIVGGVYDSDIDAWIVELDALLTLSGQAYVSFHHEPETRRNRGDQDPFVYQTSPQQ
jgi:hypothetical protein